MESNEIIQSSNPVNTLNDNLFGKLKMKITVILLYYRLYTKLDFRILVSSSKKYFYVGTILYFASLNEWMTFEAVSSMACLYRLYYLNINLRHNS